MTEDNNTKSAIVKYKPSGIARVFHGKLATAVEVASTLTIGALTLPVVATGLGGALILSPPVAAFALTCWLVGFNLVGATVKARDAQRLNDMLDVQHRKLVIRVETLEEIAKSVTLGGGLWGLASYFGA